MHQHRSSAAAISDPMMTGGITDQLASASGPLTGSGSALNQLGGGGYYPNRPATDNYGQQSLDPQQQQQQYHLGGGHHQSRYDNHYNRRHYSQQQQQPAYDPLLVNDPLLGQQQQQGQRLQADRYLQHQPQHHSSLANLPSASSKYYASDASAGLMHPSERAYYGLDSGIGAAGAAAAAATGARAGSMPPLSAMGDPTGLGAHYNAALESDPLLMGGAHSRAGLDPLAGFGGQAGLVGAGAGAGGGTYVQELRARLAEVQASFVGVKRELETATQKLGSTMHSIKTFWSPELKKERALRKEEATKYALINDQMKLMRVEVQVSSYPFPFPIQRRQ